MATAIPFNKSFEPDYGAVTKVSRCIRRVVAENPGPFTFTGSGTYIVGHGTVAIIDPGPPIKAHVEALMGAVQGETISHILVTHTHRDHSGAVPRLARLTNAMTFGFGRHGSGRENSVEGMEDVALEEGADHEFVPNIHLKDGDRLVGPDWTLEAVHTPDAYLRVSLQRLRA